MGLLDIFRLNKIKAELQQTQEQRDAFKTQLQHTEQELEASKAHLEQSQEERDALKKLLADTGRLTTVELQSGIARLEARKAKASQGLESLEALFTQRREAFDQQMGLFNSQLAAKKAELVVLDEEILLQSFGLYRCRYDLQDSEAYSAKLARVREQQAAMVKNGEAARCRRNWAVDGNREEGERMTADYTKLVLRSFNSECEASITRVKFSNIQSIEKRIRNSFDTLNRLTQGLTIRLSTEYLNLKLQELYLCHEYQVKKQEEKEEQKRIREEMREQAKLLKEIEAMKLKLEKEGQHFSRALEAVSDRLQKAQTDAERQVLEEERATIQSKLNQVEGDKLDVEKREQNTRAGYVYVISNIGSFGENVYKIGVTRRLAPEERVNELGDSSVPFDFDIHAMIFSDDAPALENALHKAFEHRKLNMVNWRREFFGVTLDEIEAVVRTNFHKAVEITRLAEAAEYRQSLSLKAQLDERSMANGGTAASDGVLQPGAPS